jgi:hypothetical protein
MPRLSAAQDVDYRTAAEAHDGRLPGARRCSRWRRRGQPTCRRCPARRGPRARTADHRRSAGCWVAQLSPWQTTIWSAAGISASSASARLIPRGLRTTTREAGPARPSPARTPSSAGRSSAVHQNGQARTGEPHAGRAVPTRSRPPRSGARPSTGCRPHSGRAAVRAAVRHRPPGGHGESADRPVRRRFGAGRGHPVRRERRPARCPAPGNPVNYLGALNPWTGQVSRVPLPGSLQPSGLLFLPAIGRLSQGAAPHHGAGLSCGGTGCSSGAW